MGYKFSPISSEDREAVIDTFNYYIENSFAAYPETRVPYEFFEFFLQVTSGYPNAVVRDENKTSWAFVCSAPILQCLHFPEQPRYLISSGPSSRKRNWFLNA